VLDPARMPEKPFSPNRPLIDLMGAVIGLAFGAGLAALLEFRDASFRTEEDVVAVLALPVLARIPQIITGADRRRSHQRRVALSTAVAVVCLGTAAIVWKLGIVNDLLR
jgi:succinoglycan biosynthesis transport protein ExoP